MSESSRGTVLMLFICAFFWGSTFPVAKFVLNEMDGLSLAIWRFVIAASLLALYMLYRRERITRLSLAQWALVIVAGVVGIGAFNWALFTGLTQTAATNGALIMALSPLVTNLLVAIIQKRWLTLPQGLGIALALLGVLLVITDGQLQRLLQLQFNHGDQLVILGMLAWSAYTVCSQYISRWLALLPFTLLSMLAGCGALLLMSLAQSASHPVAALANLSWTATAGVLYVSIFATVLGYLLWLNGVKVLGPATASLFFNLVPVFSALTALLLGQPLTAIQLLGMVIVLSGLMLAPLWQRLRRRRATA
ncbi:DMT family transporter [Idiomarina xiamenensis]|uniref:EamA domain-containing protein n=1 Tax=Idiomarina xiamenensis 10-D-4 TaxID=740709 RepID=K2KSQ0_9GAMM|nr:DMT family transporter [Idiomarina xiamenensis]EKE80630.1 hypothetical protein A10D4_11746 [Idiomarina xiamenensis 10-D-4]